MKNSNIRNPILASFASKLLPYRGLDSSILRTYKAYPDIELIDDRESNLFRAVIRRKIIQVLSKIEIDYFLIPK